MNILMFLSICKEYEDFKNNNVYLGVCSSFYYLGYFLCGDFPLVDLCCNTVNQRAVHKMAVARTKLQATKPSSQLWSSIECLKFRN